MTYFYNYVWGTHGDDDLQGTHRNDLIFGGGGDDTIFGGKGNDLLIGGDGNDTIFGGDGRDKIYGGKGNDFIIGGFGLDYIHGGEGNDTISWDNLSSGLSVDLKRQRVHFNVGGDEHFSSIENIIGSRGNDVIKGDHQANVLNGNAGNDSIFGRGGNDVLIGDEGNDHLSGGSGNDFFVGGAGNDTINGGSGFDRVDYNELDVLVSIQARGVVHKAGVGSDRVSHVQEIIGSANQENIVDARDALSDQFGTYLDVDFSQNKFTIRHLPGGGSQSFKVRNFSVAQGTENGDIMKGGDGRDFFFGNGGNDSLEGGAGDDDLFGGEGNDTLVGGLGKDFMIGGGGNDVLTSLQATDFLNGTDEEHAGAGEFDILIGGLEEDRFVLGDAQRAYYTATGDSDLAEVQDFGIGEDVIVLHGSAHDYSLEATANGININYGHERVGLVRGENIANLSLQSESFEFA